MLDLCIGTPYTSRWVALDGPCLIRAIDPLDPLVGAHVKYETVGDPTAHVVEKTGMGVASRCWHPSSSSVQWLHRGIPLGWVEFWWWTSLVRKSEEDALRKHWCLVFEMISYQVEVYFERSSRSLESWECESQNFINNHVTTLADWQLGFISPELRFNLVQPWWKAWTHRNFPMNPIEGASNDSDLTTMTGHLYPDTLINTSDIFWFHWWYSSWCTGRWKPHKKRLLGLVEATRWDFLINKSADMFGDVPNCPNRRSELPFFLGDTEVCVNIMSSSLL